MKQVVQSLKTGAVEVAEVPCPTAGRGKVLVRTRCSLISAGTERMLLEFGRAGWLEKARSQPDKVRQVLDKIRTEGLLPALEAVRGKLDQPLPLGYCNVGRVIDVGEGVSGFSIGDRVASNGPHAEVVSVPANLCARIPDEVTDEQAAFTVPGAVALHAIHLLEPSLGEIVVVTGLGLIGLLAVQLARVSGCRVLGLDPRADRREMARGFGADAAHPADALQAASALSGGRGADGVLIAASTKSNEPIHQAARMCRKRGRIVLVGVTGLELSRADFYDKELSFRVSCSYGPGRYDPEYEEKGRDYPLGYVRWTAQRNFEAVIDMMADARLRLDPLISHRFPIEQAAQAYEVLAGAEQSLAIMLTYPGPGQAEESPSKEIKLPLCVTRTSRETPAVSFIGAGNHARRVLIPAFRRAGCRLHAIASSSGLSAAHVGRKYGFARAMSDAQAALTDPNVDAVVIATRHDTHADYVIRALRAGKHVFVEKPLCLKLEELSAIERAVGDAPDRLLMIGFNRRFSPLARKMRSLVGALPGPKALVITVNAGAVPPQHWTQDPISGGGRLLGEGCHFVDLLRFLEGSPIVGIDNYSMLGSKGDTASLQVRFMSGSIATVHYFANGSRSFPKERIEAFAGGRVLQLDNFRVLRAYGWPGFRIMRLWRQDKGHEACVKAFVEILRKGGPSPIPWQELLEVSRAVIELADRSREASPPARR